MGLLNKKPNNVIENKKEDDFELLNKRVSKKTKKIQNLTKQQQENVQNALSDGYSEEIITAMFNQTEETVQNLVDILTDEEEFIDYPVHKNPALAKRVIDEVIGLGIIGDILKEYPDTTDISYNGRFLTVETNNRKFIYGADENGRVAIDLDDDYILKIVQRFAVREDKEFSEGSPIFNGFSNNIRISATHSSLSPTGITMSLRISKAKLALTKTNFNRFAPKSLYAFLGLAIKAHTNMIISGITGTGKTELLKLLVQFISFRDKIIMIEDVAETHLDTIYPEKDIYNWITKSKEGARMSDVGNITISDHVKNALRNAPRWLMVSETRGPEAYEMFQGVLTGHNLLTTLHAVNNQAVPSRFVGMCTLGDFNIDTDNLREDFVTNMGLGIHIKKKVFNDGRLLRYLDEIAEFDPDQPKGIRVIFHQNIVETEEGIKRVYQIHDLSDNYKLQIKEDLSLSFDEISKFWTPTTHEIEENISLD